MITLKAGTLEPMLPWWPGHSCTYICTARVFTLQKSHHHTLLKICVHICGLLYVNISMCVPQHTCEGRPSMPSLWGFPIVCPRGYHASLPVLPSHLAEEMLWLQMNALCPALSVFQDKDTCCQARWPEFYPRTPWQKEKWPKYIYRYTYVGTHTHMHTHTPVHINK